MKKLARSLMATLLTLSILIPVTGCRKKTKNTERIKKEDCQTLDTNSYELVVPTGTVVPSNKPDLPRNVVYWDPSRNLKDEYTIEEAQKKYAIVVGYSTLIYTACEDLLMSHTFYCTDYGDKRFQNSNRVSFQTLEKSQDDLVVTYAELKDPNCSSLSEFIDNLGYLYVGNMGHYSPEDPNAPMITIVEQTEDHVFAKVKPTSHINEGLFYGKLIGDKVFYTVYNNTYSNETMTNLDRQNFVKYSAILFEHLSPDDGVEPYIYDKIVNTPLLGSKYVTSFSNIETISGKSICLKTKKEAPIYYCYIVSDVQESFLKPYEGDTDWSESGGMKMRENTLSQNQEFVFTIDGTRYLCHINYCNEKTNVDSLESLLKLIEESCFLV